MTTEKLEGFLQKIAAPVIVALIITVVGMLWKGSILADRHERTEHRIAELEAARKEDRKVTEEFIYRIDARLAAIERDQARMLGKMEARDAK